MCNMKKSDSVYQKYLEDKLSSENTSEIFHLILEWDLIFTSSIINLYSFAEDEQWEVVYSQLFVLFSNNGEQK